ncbi:MAG: ABC transporter permease [Erysipelotrichaceae bacterium]|nr:ABC transporter permease [Erysipelotrichaceae bacterium]
MNFTDNILMAFSSLKANKMRSLLTMLGIIIGIASVIAIVTVGGSLNGSISSSLSSFGITNMTVSLTSKDDSSSGMSARMFSRNSYSESDLISEDMISEYLDAYGEYVDYVTYSESVGQLTIRNGSSSENITISGVNMEYADANELNILTGRWFNQNDYDSKNNYLVIGSDLVSDLYDDSYTDLIGTKTNLNINGITESFYIIGVYETDDSSSMMSTCYIPVSTAKHLMRANDGYSTITVIAKTDVESDAFLSATETFFQSFYLRNDTYTVSVSNLASMLETMSSILSTVTYAISAIAAISLLVGGIGVMNIMLVSITERTREIGTRKALGAKNSAIRMQFIVESVIVCLIGGVIGIALGIALGLFAANLLGMNASISMSTCLGSMLFSMAIGVFFGYYPANKAASMNPIDALRYE